MKNKYFRLLILLIPVLLSISSCSSQKIETRLRIAEELKGTRKFDEALQVYKLITTNYPNDERAAAAYLKMGDLNLFTLKDSNEALIAYSKVAEKWPFTVEAREATMRKAEVLTNRGDLRKAVIEYEWIYKHFPDHEDKDRVKLLVAESYLNMSDPYQASIELEELLKDEEIDLETIESEKSNGPWWACLGEKCIFTERDLKKSCLSDEVFSKALFDLGESYLFLEQFDKALKYFQVLNLQFPEVPFIFDVRLKIGECLEKTKFD